LAGVGVNRKGGEAGKGQLVLVGGVKGFVRDKKGRKKG